MTKICHSFFFRLNGVPKAVSYFLKLTTSVTTSSFYFFIK
ncbi:hypothetical protein HMPREF0352_2418 [Enterococcus faecium TX1330]|nr:hypothetical protein HMPREF0352_2418 [Enterococcus faecium TX1330]EJV49361.1 hypothetical protein HMPREF1345_01919 [Enterococcus faecium TX1337RF]SJX71068.1 hypothetical protein FM130_10140 [Enterococcus faecium]